MVGKTMIKIGLTELHGIAQEQVKNAPPNFCYSTITPVKDFFDFFFTSTAKGVLNQFDSDELDFIEAPLFPIRTTKNWVYTPADTASAMAFSFLNLPTPRVLRQAFLARILEKENLIALLFKSEAGLKTLEDYPILAENYLIKQKTGVLYPAIRQFPEREFKKNQNHVRILFVGEFFRKGGVHVVDSFVKLREKHPNLELLICANRDVHFEGPEKHKYLHLIDTHPAIELNFLSREDLFKYAYQKSDIYVLPTYQESFGYSILEAMANSLPVVATRHFAIPEMVNHGQSGILVASDENFLAQFSKGYSVRSISVSAKEQLTREVYLALDALISDPGLREAMGKHGRKIVLRKFSFEKRNEVLNKLYAK